MEMTTIELYGHAFAECFTLSTDFRVPSVMSDDACLAYVQSGTQEVFSATQKIVARDRESILMKCGNYIANFRIVSPNDHFKSVVFHLDPLSIRKAFGDKDLNFLNIDRNMAPKDSALKVDRSELLDSFVASMMPYFDKPELANEELVAVKLQELVYILSDSGKNTLATQIIGTLYTPIDIAFEKVINANLYNNLSIGELSLLSARSESTFKRDFKKLYNLSPAKYFKTKRLQKAAELLKSSNHQISEIAWSCGFENAAHFSTSFHGHFGTSPREFRS